MKDVNAQFYHYLLLIALCISLLPAAFAANNFVSIRLPHGVQIELPRNWNALSNNQRITLDSSVQSRNELAGIFPFAKIAPPQKDLATLGVSMRCELKRKMEDVNSMGVLILSISRELLDSSEISLKVELGDIVQAEHGPLSERWLMNKAESLVCDVLDKWIEACSHETSTVG